jgi:hypothetical protein
MGKLNIKMFVKVHINRLPVLLIIPDFFAACADRQHALQLHQLADILKG